MNTFLSHCVDESNSDNFIRDARARMYLTLD